MNLLGSYYYLGVLRYYYISKLLLSAVISNKVIGISRMNLLKVKFICLDFRVLPTAINIGTMIGIWNNLYV